MTQTLDRKGSSALIEQHHKAIELLGQIDELENQYREIADNIKRLESMNGSAAPAAAEGETKVRRGRKAAPAPAASASGESESGLTWNEAVVQVIKPTRMKGLKPSEVVEEIEKQGLKTSKGDMASIVQGTIFKLKKDKVLVRNAEKRYVLAQFAKKGK